MYAVSEAFLEATKKKNRVSKIEGTITTKNGSIIKFDDSNLVKGSLAIDNRCVNSNNFEYGAVYQGQLTCSVIDTSDRYSIFDGKINLTYYIQLPDGTFEGVPMGVFYISEPTRTHKILSIKAYDGMQFLDIPVDEEVYGAVYDLLLHIATKCGVELAQTREEIEAFTNGKQIFTLIPDRLSTYRDAVAYLGMMMCSFATFDRNGKLRLVQFGTEAVDTFTESERKTSTFSDFETYYSAVTARFIAEENWAPYDASVDGAGLTLDMGDIPIVQGLATWKNELMKNILSTLYGVRYVPCNVTLAGGNPAIDLGDMITNRQGDTELVSLVTKITWKYRQNQVFESAGSNPKLAGIKDKNSKHFSSMEKDIITKNIEVISATNAEQIEITSENMTKILKANFAGTIEGARPIFITTIQIESTLDGYLDFVLMVNGITENTFRYYVERGQHTLMFHHDFPVEKDMRYTAELFAQAFYFESDKRKQDAEIATQQNAIVSIVDYIKKKNEEENSESGETESGTETVDETIAEETEEIVWETVPVDETPPLITVQPELANMIIYAQGITSSVKWDGTLVAFDKEAGTVLTGLTRFVDCIEDIVIEPQIPTGAELAIGISSMTFARINLGDITDTVAATATETEA